ncbi:MAG TPA: pseudouridine synthase [Polyangiaceae bacterium]|nr:pseudouridine synthase [Polyangiaceae bacterium]
MSAPSDPGIAAAPPQGERVACEHADRCGGCPIIGLSYSEQLALKRGRVVQSLSRYPSLELVYTDAVAPAEPIVGYRSRAKLIVAPGGKIGLFAKGGGHDVVDIPRCRVVSPAIARVVADLRARVSGAEATGGVLAPIDASGSGGLRALDVREVRSGDTSHVLVTFVIDRARAAEIPALRDAAEALMRDRPEVVGVAVNLHDGRGPQILGGETVALSGVSSAPDRIGPTSQFATFGSFVQAHRGQAERVQAMLVDALGVARPPNRRLRVLDLYGGSGAIALALAAAGARVTLVESFAPAASQARVAARSQDLDVDVECGDAAGVLRRLAVGHEEYDAAVLNPPRRGTSPATREWLSRLAPPTVAYVSCDPETLARDLDHFARLGYAATSLRPLDMIPLTDEVETVAVIRRGGAPTPPVVYEDAEILIVEKAPHEPTTPQGEYSSSLLTRARRIPGAELCVPVNKLDVGTSGLVVLARSPASVARWQAVFSAESTRDIYVAAVRGVTPAKGTVARDLRDGGKVLAARTRYRRLVVAAGHSVLRVVPDRARTHQIRRHLAAIGHPVLGDDRYGHMQTNRHFEEKNTLDRTFLHCVRLEISHPTTGARHVVESALPGDLRAVLERTGGPGTLRFLDHKNALGAVRASSIPPGVCEAGEVDGRPDPLDIDAGSPTMRPEPTDDDDILPEREV